MRLSQFIKPDLVLLELHTEGVEDTLHAFAERLGETGHVAEVEGVERALIEREESHTTSLGNGVALPHATVPGLERPLIMVGVAPDGVAFQPDEEDAVPNRLFFVLLSPANEAGTHIKLLARIVRLVRSRGFVEALIKADTGEALIDQIERVDAQHV